MIVRLVRLPEPNRSVLPLSEGADSCYTYSMKNLSPTTGNIGYFVATEFGPNFFRFGMTKNGRSPYERWSEDADYRKCGNPAQFEHEFYELGDKLDHDIHNLLKKCPGIRVASHDIVRSPEVFECEFGLEYAKNLIESLIAEVVGKAAPIRSPLDSRPYQHSFVEMFKASRGDFCLFAKCRAGKSAMVILAANECDYHSVLVASYRTSAANSWRDDVVTYTKFHEWDVIDLSDKSWEFKVEQSQQAGRRQLLVSTVQRQNEKFGYIGKVKSCYPNGIDLLAIDECHIGGESTDFGKLKKGITHRRLLEISGTAYKTIWKYPNEKVFVWGYVEEQRAKREGYEWAQKLPKMELVMARYDARAKNEIYGNDPDALKNVFAVKDGKWQDFGSVQSYLRQFFSYGAMCHKKQQMLRNSQHIVMTMPSVEACYLFAESLQEFGSPFVPLVITGESGNGQAEILNHVRTHEATICLTRWANVVGVTVPQWDTVIHGCEYQSAEFWVQFAFRGGSTKRESWKVIDFAPERALSSLLEMASATSAASDETDAESVLRTLLEFADVFEFTNGYRELDYNTILIQELANIASAKAESRAAMGEVTQGNNLEAIAWALEGLDRVKDEVRVAETLNSNDTNGNGNVQLQRDSVTPMEDTKKMKQALAAVKAAVGKLDDVITVGLLNDVHLSTLPKLLSFEKFEMFTGCSPEVFQFVIDSGWVNPESLNARVSRMHLSLSAAMSISL